MSDSLLKVRYGLSAERLMHECELTSALGLAVGDLSTNISFRSLDYDKRVSLLSTLLKPMIDSNVHQAIQISDCDEDEELVEIWNEHYAGADQAVISNSQAHTALEMKIRKRSSLEEEDLPEHLRQIFEAAKPENKSDLHKLLRGFPNLNDRAFDSPFKDNFMNAMIRDCIVRFMEIIDGGKISMKVACNIYKHLFSKYLIEHRVGYSWNTIRNYEKAGVHDIITSNQHSDWGSAINANNMTFDSFLKFWSANMCTQEVCFRHSTVSDEVLGKLETSGDLDMLNTNLGDVQWGQTYYLPRTQEGIKFMKTLSRIKAPLIATGYMISNEPSQKIDLADMTIKHVSIGSRDPRINEMVSVDDLVSITT
jgi:hypothetical protein